MDEVAGSTEQLGQIVVEQPEPLPPRPRRRSGWAGAVSLTFALLTVVGLAGALVVATLGLYVLGELIAWVTVGTGALAVVFGLIGLIGRWGVGTAVVGLVLGVVANPFVLTAGLGSLR
jgi:hypothetical protein